MTTPAAAHPRPTLRREAWTDLDGAWGFAHDDEDRGLAERWYAPEAAGRDEGLHYGCGRIGAVAREAGRAADAQDVVVHVSPCLFPGAM